MNTVATDDSREQVWSPAGVDPHRYRMVGLLGGVLVSAGLFLLSRDRYLLFHGLIECFTVTVYWLIFSLAWNARRLLDNHYLLFLGIGSFFVGIIDLLHTFAFKGMGIFPVTGSNLATQLWIAGRYLQAATLLLAFLFLRRRLRVAPLCLAYAVVGGVLVAAIFAGGMFPDCYLEGSGLTPFKIVSEYVIIGLFLTACGVLLRCRDSFDQVVQHWLIASLILTAGSELAFTHYLNVYGPANMLGHLFRLWAVYCLYRAFVVTALVKPYDLLFRDLVRNKTELTRLNESLEVMVEDRTAELRAMNGQLQEELGQRRAAEAALLESEERSWGIFDAVNDAIFLHDRQTGEILAANRRMSELYGYSSREALYLTVGEISSGIAPYTETEASGLMAKAVTEGPQLFEWHARRRDGTLFWAEVNMRSADFGGHGYLLVTVRDISERKEAEAELRRVRNYLANIIDSMPSLLVGMEPDGTVSQWNRRAVAATGIPASQAIGRPVGALLTDFSPWIDELRGEIVSRRPAVREKLPLLKEGETRYYDLMAYPLVANCVEGAVVRIEDVTERTMVQELMVQTEKMMSVGGLAAGMAHEINNPLGIITQAAQNIERRVSPELPANRLAAGELGLDLDLVCRYFGQRQISQFLASIREAAARASRIVANMLQFSRRSEAVMLLTPLGELIDRTIELAASDYDLKKKFDFRNIEIIRDFPPDLPAVPVIVVEMEQVVLNLLKNAAQAMAGRAGCPPPMIRLRLRREDPWVVLEVEDNGPGMDESVRRRVFEPFFTTKEPGMGTGLGLSVSYMIVTGNHGGILTVSSSPGRGTCFTVKLPLQQAVIADTEHGQSRHAFDQSGGVS